jgi:hypothetical protein
LGGTRLRIADKCEAAFAAESLTRGIFRVTVGAAVGKRRAAVTATFLIRQVFAPAVRTAHRLTSGAAISHLIYHPPGIATSAPRVCKAIGTALALAAEIHDRGE